MCTRETVGGGPRRGVEKDCLEAPQAREDNPTSKPLASRSWLRLGPLPPV